MHRKVMMSLGFGLIGFIAGCSYEQPNIGESPADGGPDFNWGTSGAPSNNDPNAIDNDGDGFSEYEGDCRDDQPEINPGALDDTCDHINQNCSGGDGEDDTLRDSNDCGGDDEDEDGVTDVIDCDDDDADTYPGAAENEPDLDDQAACSRDGDRDGFGDEDVTDDEEDDGMRRGTDCDDDENDVNPDENEIDNNNVDDDCDGEVDDDGDNDEFDEDCDNWGEEAGDCDDEDEDVFPFAGTNEEDEDAFLGCGRDADGDGYTDATISDDEEDAGMVAGTDCDDSDEDVNPGEDNCDGDNDDGMTTLRIVNDGSYTTGATDSWEIWAWNDTQGDGYWPEWSTPWYCGTGVTNSISCELPADTGDIVWLNGAWDQAHRWLLENYQGSIQNHMQSVSFGGNLHSLSLTEDSTPALGACTRDPGTYNFICKVDLD